jgi:hypothetical protein
MNEKTEKSQRQVSTNDDGRARKAYKSPTLTKWGSVDSLTRGDSGGRYDEIGSRQSA